MIKASVRKGLSQKTVANETRINRLLWKDKGVIYEMKTKTKTNKTAYQP